MMAAVLVGTWSAGSLGARIRDMIEAARSGNVAAHECAGFLELWRGSGVAIRGFIGDDAALIGVLRAVLPPYEGPGMTLYRGDAEGTWSQRGVGLSWTSEIAVAERFAKAALRTFSGGVVLMATAPARAIICGPDGLAHDQYAEREFVVDPRWLGDVRVVRRYPEGAALAVESACVTFPAPLALAAAY